MTAASGEFTFVGVAPGNYVVRTMANNQAAGTRIAVNAGQSIPVTVVLPSLATASPQSSIFTSFFISLLSSGGMAAANEIFTQAQESNDFAFISSLVTEQYATFFADLINNESFERIMRIGPYTTF
jgi:hypothetical protein